MSTVFPSRVPAFVSSGVPHGEALNRRGQPKGPGTRRKEIRIGTPGTERVSGEEFSPRRPGDTEAGGGVWRAGSGVWDPASPAAEAPGSGSHGGVTARSGKKGSVAEVPVAVLFRPCSASCSGSSCGENDGVGC